MNILYIQTKDAEQTIAIAAAIDETEADAIYIVGGDGTISNVSCSSWYDYDSIGTHGYISQSTIETFITNWYISWW